jgi:hypothetical protein
VTLALSLRVGRLLEFRKIDGQANGELGKISCSSNCSLKIDQNQSCRSSIPLPVDQGNP